MIFSSGEALNERFGWEGDRSPMGVYWMGYINILAPEGWIDGSTGARAQIFRRMGPMAHEYTHLIIDEKTHGHYPRWFSEGVAQYVEQSLGYFTTTLPQPENRRFLPFSQLERRFDEASQQNQAYWQSLEAIHYLTAHYGEAIIGQILTHLSQNRDFQTALQLTTGLDESALLAALTASRTASSCAQQTETVFFSHLVTCSTKSPKLLLIFLTSLNFSFLYRKPSTTHSSLQIQTYRITKKTKGQLYLIIPPDTQVCLLLCCIKPL